MKTVTQDTSLKYPMQLFYLHSDLPFLAERMKVKECEKPVFNLYNEKKYDTHKSPEASIGS